MKVCIIAFYSLDKADVSVVFRNYLEVVKRTMVFFKANLFLEIRNDQFVLKDFAMVGYKKCPMKPFWLALFSPKSSTHPFEGNN